MIFNTENRLKSLFLGLTFFCLLLPYHFANASILSNFTDGLTDLKGLVNRSIVIIKNDFCYLYTVSVSSGDWAANDFRAKIGATFCAGYKIQIGEGTTEQTPAERAIEISNISKQNATNNLVQNNYLPNPLFGNTNASGNKLNSSEIIYWTNIERAKNDNGLKALTENSILTLIALSRVQDMFDKGYFAHISPTGDSASKMATRDNYKYITIGENIALGNFGGSRDLVNAWMNSPGHRANILNQNYTEIGVAAIEGLYKGQKVWISAQIFGKPLSGCTSPETALKDRISKDKVYAESLNTNMKNIQAQLQAINSFDTATYNIKAAEYNNLAKLYNNLVAEIKTLTATYNLEVQKFNDCIKTI
jgi:uncharacterized protein YkwD